MSNFFSHWGHHDVLLAFRESVRYRLFTLFSVRNADARKRLCFRCAVIPEAGEVLGGDTVWQIPLSIA